MEALGTQSAAMVKRRSNADRAWSGSMKILFPTRTTGTYRRRTHSAHVRLPGAEAGSGKTAWRQASTPRRRGVAAGEFMVQPCCNLPSRPCHCRAGECTGKAVRSTSRFLLAFPRRRGIRPVSVLEHRSAFSMLGPRIRVRQTTKRSEARFGYPSASRVAGGKCSNTSESGFFL